MINELLSLDEVLTARSLFRAGFVNGLVSSSRCGNKEKFFNSKCFVHGEAMNKTLFVVLDER